MLVRAQERQILRSAHLHGDRTQRINNRRPQRHERQARRQLRFEDFVLSLSFGHEWAGGWGLGRSTARRGRLAPTREPCSAVRKYNNAKLIAHRCSLETIAAHGYLSHSMFDE